MPELEDLRGRDITWTLTSRRPLRCAISIAPDGRGSLVQDGIQTPIRAGLAGVWWQVESETGIDSVTFYEGGLQIAQSKGLLSVPYEIEVDGWAGYRFWFDPEGGRTAWLDEKNRHVVVFLRHSLSAWGRSGSIVVSNGMLIEHAPVLIILGLIRIAQKSAFSKFRLD